MSSQELDRLLETLKIDPDGLNTDVDTRMCEFDEGLSETLRNRSGQAPSMSKTSQLARNRHCLAVTPLSLGKPPGTMVKSEAGRSATLAAKRGKDDAKFTVEAYGYKEECKGRSHFCFDTSDEIDIGIHETTGNKVVKIYKQTLKELEEWLRDLLTKDNYVHVHRCIETFLKVHIEEGKPLPVKLVRRFGQ
jgi:hypothetical protein